MADMHEPKDPEPEKQPCMRCGAPAGTRGGPAPPEMRRRDPIEVIFVRDLDGNAFEVKA